MPPRQRFIQWALPLSIEEGVKASLIEGAEPYIIIKSLAPAIKASPQLPGSVDDLAQPPVSS
jgi:hypothetical protein